MPVTFQISHLYKYPLEMVADVHLHKYPALTEKNITAVDTLEHYQSVGKPDLVTYWRRIAHCKNIIPGLIRRFNSVIDEPEILIQEECWLYHHPRRFLLKTQNMTWGKYVECSEDSEYRPSPENPEWTECVQTGKLAIFGIGPVGSVIEKVLKKILDKGMAKGIELTERILKSQSTMLPPHQPNFLPLDAPPAPVRKPV